MEANLPATTIVKRSPLLWIAVNRTGKFTAVRRRHLVMVALVALVAAPLTASTGGLTPAAAAPCESTLAAPPMTAIPGLFHGIAPVRIVDSRNGTGDVARLTPGCVAAIDVGASGAVPAQARAVSVNVTSTDSLRPGFLVVFPCGTPVPPTSNLNTQVDAAVPNLVIVSLPESRRICVLADHVTNVIVDVTGWFGSGGSGFLTGGSATDTTSVRMLDTRTSPRPDAATTRWPAATELALQVGPVGASPKWESVSANITVTDPVGAGFVVAYPCGQPVPATSTVNVVARGTRANQTLVALDATGRLCLWSSVETHLIVDVVGHFVRGAGAPLALSAAQRVVDSRNGTGGWTTPFRAGLTRPLDPAGGAAATADVALLNVVATGVTEEGFLTFYRCGSPVPTTSSLNFAPGQDVTNLVTVDANTCVTGTGVAHVVVDRLGWFGRPGGLASLSAGTPGTLQPEFEPDGHDYSVPCAAGSNTIAIEADAVPGRTVSIAGGASSASVARAVSLLPNEVANIVVTAPNGSTETYALRCLPPDFPAFTAHVPGSPAPGWYLTTLGYRAVPTPGIASYAAIFDEHGAVVWYRKVPQPIVDMKRLKSGDLVWTKLGGFAPFGTDPARGFERHRLDGTLVSTLFTTSGPTDHHDVRELPNGHLLLLSYVGRTGVNVSALGGPCATNTRVVDAVIEEIDPTLPSGSAPVWSWNSKDHFNLNETTFVQCFNADGSGDGSNETVDLVHVNSIEPQSNGDIVASFRHLDAVARISRTTGDIVWKLGGTTTTHDAGVGAKVLAVTDDPLGGPKRQHSATVLPNGNLLLFDNRTTLGASIGPARAAEYVLDLTANTAKLVWHLDHPLGQSAFGLGSVARLGDGDTVMNWGPLQPSIAQYDAAGATQLTISEPNGIGYRVAKEPPASFDRATLRALAG
jgi:Arylsulfotransferase (ASST)